MQFAPKRNGQQKSERALFYGPIKKDYERGMYVLLLVLYCYLPSFQLQSLKTTQMNHIAGKYLHIYFVRSYVFE